MRRVGGRDYALFDGEDGFFYDILHHADGRYQRFRVRSLVGLIPLFAVERLEQAWLEQFSEFSTNMKSILEGLRRSSERQELDEKLQEEEERVNRAQRRQKRDQDE